MPSWIMRITGVRELLWGRPAPTALLLAALAAAAVLTAFLYRRPGPLPGRVRAGLAVARLIVLLGVSIALFEPIARVERTRGVKRRLAVLVDVSESMAISDQRKRPADLVEAAVVLGLLDPAAAEDAQAASAALDTRSREAIAAASRLDLARRLITRSGRPVFDALSADLEIDYYAFGASLRLLGDGTQAPADALEGLRAEERGGSIAAALEGVAAAGRGLPLAGIVLLSDGLDASPRRMEPLLRDLGIRGVPVHAVPVGLADPDDVSIRNIVMQDVAFSGDTVPVRVQIQSKGYERRSAPITVRLNGRTVAQRDIRLAGGLQFEDVFFNMDMHERGAARIEIEIEPFADEATAANNRVERSVNVVNEKVNVLCIEGSARWEYRYLRAMLKRDPRINATFIATRADPAIARGSTEYIARFPERREDAFQYDLVILGDVDAGFFSGDELLRLEELVRERGGSLLMLAGARFAPSSYAGTPVEKMLPVTFEAGRAWEEVDDAVHPVLTPEGRSSLVMTLEMDPSENDRVWRRVAPMDRVPPLLHSRPGATVLATLSDSITRVRPYPLVAWQRYGTGKCMLIGTDRMWLLRFKTGDMYHWRAWSQYIQFMTLSRLMGEHKRIRLESDRSIYPVDGQVRLHANLLDDRYEPILQPGFEVVVTPLDIPGAPPRTVSLLPDAEVPGLYEGHYSPPQPGRYRVEANEGDRSLANTTEFQVSGVESALASTELQIDKLRRIAESTGGTYLGMPRIEELPALLERGRHLETYTTDLPLWDNAWMMMLLVGLMGLEWIVRRRYDLP